MLGERATLLWKKVDSEQLIDENELDADVDVLCLHTLDVLMKIVLYLISNMPTLVGYYF